MEKFGTPKSSHEIQKQDISYLKELSNKKNIPFSKEFLNEYDRLRSLSLTETMLNASEQELHEAAEVRKKAHEDIDILVRKEIKRISEYKW